MGPVISSETSEITESEGRMEIEEIFPVVSVRGALSPEMIFSINFAGIKSYTGGKY